MQIPHGYAKLKAQPTGEAIAMTNELALLFLDASHFVMGCDFLGYIYGKTRRLVQTFSGRMRYNVLGAMDYATKQVLTVTNDSYITATQVCQMLEKIAVAYYGMKIPPMMIVIFSVSHRGRMSFHRVTNAADFLDVLL